jgi:hypothetical protein
VAGDVVAELRQLTRGPEEDEAEEDDGEPPDVPPAASPG